MKTVFNPKEKLITLFPEVPTCAFPEVIPDEIWNSEMLVSFVKNNMNTILDRWTFAIRFNGINGRLMMHEDDEVNEKNRQSILIDGLWRRWAYANR